MIHFILFLATNIPIILIFGIILGTIGVQCNNIYIITASYIIFSLSGSIMSLYLSKKTSLKSVNGKIIQKPHNNMEKWLFKIIAQQSNLVGIKTPEIAIYSSSTMNAFTAGFEKNNALIAISSGLLKNMNQDEIEAVIAHEITHISNGDMITMILIQSAINISIIFISQTILRYLWKLFCSYQKNNYKKFSIQKSFSYSLFKMTMKFAFSILSTLIIMWFSRKREFYADAGAIKIVGEKKIISALKRLKKSYPPKEPDSIITLCIHGKNKESLDLLLSHPSLDQRIMAIKKRKYN